MMQPSKQEQGEDSVFTVALCLIILVAMACLATGCGFDEAARRGAAYREHYTGTTERPRRAPVVRWSMQQGRYVETDTVRVGGR